MDNDDLPPVMDSIVAPVPSAPAVPSLSSSAIELIDKVTEAKDEKSGKRVINGLALGAVLGEGAFGKVFCCPVLHFFFFLALHVCPNRSDFSRIPKSLPPRLLSK